MRLTIVLAALAAMALHTLPAGAANPLAEKTIGFDVFKTSYGARGLGNVLPLLVVYDDEGDCRAILTPESFGKLQGDIQRALGDPASACTFELVPEFAAVLRSRPTERELRA